jgi:hypothetical protein
MPTDLWENTLVKNIIKSAAVREAQLRHVIFKTF